MTLAPVPATDTFVTWGARKPAGLPAKRLLMDAATPRQVVKGLDDTGFCTLISIEDSDKEDARLDDRGSILLSELLDEGIQRHFRVKHARGSPSTAADWARLTPLSFFDCEHDADEDQQEAQEDLEYIEVCPDLARVLQIRRGQEKDYFADLRKRRAPQWFVDLAQLMVVTLAYTEFPIEHRGLNSNDPGDHARPVTLSLPPASRRPRLTDMVAAISAADYDAHTTLRHPIAARDPAEARELMRMLIAEPDALKGCCTPAEYMTGWACSCEYRYRGFAKKAYVGLVKDLALQAHIVGASWLAIGDDGEEKQLTGAPRWQMMLEFAAMAGAGAAHERGLLDSNFRIVEDHLHKARRAAHLRSAVPDSDNSTSFECL